MKSISRPFLHTLALCAFTATLIAGCGKKDEPVVQAEKKEVTKDVVKSVAAPTIEQTKAIAEEALALTRIDPFLLTRPDPLPGLAAWHVKERRGPAGGLSGLLRWRET